MPAPACAVLSASVPACVVVAVAAAAAAAAALSSLSAGWSESSVSGAPFDALELLRQSLALFSAAASWPARASSERRLLARSSVVRALREPLLLASLL